MVFHGCLHLYVEENVGFVVAHVRGQALLDSRKCHRRTAAGIQLHRHKGGLPVWRHWHRGRVSGPVRRKIRDDTALAHAGKEICNNTKISLIENEKVSFFLFFYLSWRHALPIMTERKPLCRSLLYR